MRVVTFVILFAALALLPTHMFAVDGVVLINQSTVMAAGGFPYTISQPGSYKLSGNLTVPANANGLVITASNVSIDLDGFSITGPDRPTSLGRSTWGISPEVGGIATVVTGITIRNGVIRGFTSPLLPLENNMWVLEELILQSGAGLNYNIGLGAFSIVRHVTASSMSISVACPSVVVDSAAETIYIDGGTGACALAHNAMVFAPIP